MMANELLRELLQATLASSAAIVLLQALRRPLRARFGARLAYRAWLLVPVATLAVWLPARSAGSAEAGAAVLAHLGPIEWTQGIAASAPAAWSGGVLAAWFAGGVATLLCFVLRQRGFLLQLSRRPERAFDTVEGQGPALVGWLKPRIVLPSDFRERYTRGERRLVLAHEIAHLRAGDIHAQALASALRCLFWFNPLVHLAAVAFRFDQELACDATVLGKFPRGRGRYGSAMLKTQLAVTGLPVGCHWQSSHPIKERIEMLKQPLPARTRKLAGSLLVATLVGCGTWAAWAAQPAQAAPTTPTTSDATLLTQISAEDELTPPEYPKGAMADGKADIEGTVDIELLVGADGHVKDVKILKADPAGIFEQATIAAARQWKLKPATRDGRPVEGRVRTQVEFRRDEKN